MQSFPTRGNSRLSHSSMACRWRSRLHVDARAMPLFQRVCAIGGCAIGNGSDGITSRNTLPYPQSCTDDAGSEGTENVATSGDTSTTKG
mmetsp:Transcript_1389/g.2843  ORF Transcript_1389/g.2843 Transcript_1389/m.2843 type:complete len:89 (+) Transcript_1389:926-1192(+)